MGLQQSGVELVVKGDAQFMAAMNRANAAIASIGHSANSTVTPLGNLSNAVAVGSAKWAILSSAIGKTTAALSNMSNVAIAAAGELQTLEMRLASLAARQARAADASIDMAESLRRGGIMAQDMLAWIRELALQTPFSSEKISEVLSFATAMGWGVDQAKELTAAILDYSAGMGLGNEVMDRIIYNFAQMKAAGKVTATEMRDLARGAFFPLTAILDEAANQLGIAGDNLMEFRKAAADGSIDVETFFSAFIAVVGRDFPNAARRMNDTMAALKDNAMDFFRVIVGWNVLGPSIEFITTKLNNLLRALTSSKAIQSSERIGQAIAYVAESFFMMTDAIGSAMSGIAEALGLTMPSLRDFVKLLVMLGGIMRGVASLFTNSAGAVATSMQRMGEGVTEAAGTVGNAFDGVIEQQVTGFAKLGGVFGNFVNNTVRPFVESFGINLDDGLAGIASSMFSWGANIVSQLARGIIAAAVGILQQAIQFIGDMLTFWFSPGSPPAILPDIDDWGTAAMAEFLHGFTMADFSVLDSIQDAVKGSLDAIVDLGSMLEDDAGFMFVEISEAMILALDEFNKTGEMSNEIFAKLRSIGGVFGEETATLLTLQIELATATKLAAEAQERLNLARERSIKANGEVNKQIKEYNAMLRSGAGRQELRNKLKLVNAAEEELTLARKQERAAEIAANDAEKALGPIKEAVKLQEKLIQELIELAKAQADAEKARQNRLRPGGGGGGGGGDGGGGELPPFSGGGGGGGAVTGWFEQIKQEALEQLGDLWTLIGDLWNQALRDIFDSMGVDFDEFAAKVLAVWNDITAQFGRIFANLQAFWDENGASIIDTVITTIMGVFENLGKLIILVIQFMLDELEKWSQWFKDNGPLIAEFIAFLGDLLVRLSAFAVTVWTALEPALRAGGEAFRSLLTLVMEVATSEWFGKIIDTIERVATTIVTKIGEGAVTVIEWFSTKIDELGAWFDANGDTLAEAVNNVGIAIETLAKIIVNQIPNALEIIDTFLLLLAGVVTVGLDLIALDWSKAGGDLLSYVSDFDTAMIGLLDNPLAWLVAFPLMISMAIASAERSILASIDVMDVAFGSALTLLMTLLPDDLVNITIAFFDAGVAIVQAIIDGLVSMGLVFGTEIFALLTISPEDRVNVMEGFVNTGKEIVQSVITAIGEESLLVGAALLSLLSLSPADRTTITGNFVSAGAEIVQKVMDGIESMGLVFGATLTSFLTLTPDQLADALTSFFNAGVDMIEQIASGSSSVSEALYSAVYDIVADALGAIWDAIAAGGTGGGGGTGGSGGGGGTGGSGGGAKPSKPPGRPGVESGITWGDNFARAASEEINRVLGETFDELGDNFDLGRMFSSAGSGFARLFQQQSIDPLEELISTQDDRIKEINKLLAAGGLDYYAQIALQAELAQLEQERAESAEELVSKQERLLALQEQQQKLSFLQQQFDLVQKIQEFGLDPTQILGGIELGVNASLDDLLIAMTRAMAAIVEATEAELEIASPSKVFARIGSQLMNGMALGIGNTAMKPINSALAVSSGLVSAARVAAQPVASHSSNVAFGDVYINDRMDWATFKAGVQRAVAEMMQ